MSRSLIPFQYPLAGGSSSDSSSSSAYVYTVPKDPTATQFEAYCQNVLVYLSTCINGPDIIKYCHTEGLYCTDNSGPYNLNNVQVQCNATVVSLCPERYYCPNPYTKIACPRGHFCREGQCVGDISCTLLSFSRVSDKMNDPANFTFNPNRNFPRNYFSTCIASKIVGLDELLA